MDVNSLTPPNRYMVNRRLGGSAVRLLDVPVAYVFHDAPVRPLNGPTNGRAMATELEVPVVTNFSALVPNPPAGAAAIVALAVFSGLWIHPAPGIVETVVAARAIVGTSSASPATSAPALAPSPRVRERRMPPPLNQEGHACSGKT